MKKVAYFYFIKNDPEKIGQIVPSHVQYWHSLALEAYKGGGFSDRSGGMIIFNSKDLNEASQIIKEDPFVKNDLIAQGWTKEWMVE